MLPYHTTKALNIAVDEWTYLGIPLLPIPASSAWSGERRLHCLALVNPMLRQSFRSTTVLDRYGEHPSFRLLG